MSEEVIVKFEHVSKEYRLGAIGGGTLKADLQSWMARLKGKEDPNKILWSDAWTKAGKKFLALDDISFEVKKGEALGIIGHNGAGKSTLLKLLSRVTAPSKGQISYNGRVASMLEVGTGFHPELTGRENVYMNGAILGMTKAEIDEKFDEIVHFAEMEEFIDTPVKRYSSGMFVKLAFAVAAHLDSEIMIMDEVLAVGDMNFQKKCLAKMRSVADVDGRTIFYVSHNMNTIRQLCDRCIVLNHGKIIFDGDVEKAIEVYMDENGISKQFVDLNALKNSKHVSAGAKLNSICLLDRERWQFAPGETVNFKLSFLSEVPIENLGFCAYLVSADNIPISVMKTSEVTKCEEGKQYEITLNIDLSQLSVGRYIISPALFTENVDHSTKFYDSVDQAIVFEIVNSSDDEELRWEKRWQANVIMPDVQIENIRVIE